VKKLLLFTIVFCWIVDNSLASTAAESQVFHISPTGNDANPGTMEQPFASLKRAQEAIRQLAVKGLNQSITVYLHQGAYGLETPLVFGPFDGGTEQFSVTYAAAPGEIASIRAGKEIKDWKRLENNLWTAKVPEAEEGKWRFRELFADGQRLPRGRFPNGDDQFLRVKSVSKDKKEIVFEETLPFNSLKGREAEIVAIQNWALSRSLISDSNSRRVVSANPLGLIGHGDSLETSPGKPVFLENAAEFVDQPGEWSLEGSIGVVTYCAQKGEDPNVRHFIAPTLEEIVIVEGTREEPVRNLHFEGLIFEYAAWRMPKEGYMGIQAGHFAPNVNKPYMILPLAVRFAHAADCGMKRCQVRHTGASAIGLGAGSLRIQIEGCNIYDVGGNGIMTGWRGEEPLERRAPSNDSGLEADWANPYDAPASNEIVNNLVHNCGAVNWGCVGIFDAFSIQTHIAHNDVYDLPYTGISIGYRWNTNPSSQRGGIVEYNHIYNVMKRLADGGGIYTLGYQPYATLRGNLIHDVGRSSYAQGGAPNNGVFQDQGSSGFLIEENIIYTVSGDPVRFNQCAENMQTWKNNYFRISPSLPGYPETLAIRAGVEEKYKNFWKELGL